MPTTQDLRNLVLSRLRQNGVSFGASPTNQATDYVNPYVLTLQLNLGYEEMLSRVKDWPLATVEVSFQTTLNAQFYSLNPIPPNLGVLNPAAMRVHEMTYTQVGAQERDVDLVSTERFRRDTGAYVRRFGNYGPLPYEACQLYGRRQLDIFPGTAVVGDEIELTITPDPMRSDPSVPTALGGQLVNDADVPIIPDEFHMGIVAYACWQLGMQLARLDFAKEQQAEFDGYVERAVEFASALGAGMAEQTVQDTIADTLLAGLNIP